MFFDLKINNHLLYLRQQTFQSPKHRQKGSFADKKAVLAFSYRLMVVGTALKYNNHQPTNNHTVNNIINYLKYS
jgi:hypothetical protein